MRELGELGSGGAENQDVFERVGQMVLTAHDVADAQVDIVGAGGQMVGGRAVAAEQGEILDVVDGFRLVAEDEVANRIVSPSRGTR